MLRKFSTAMKYNSERKGYKNKLTELRKAWSEDYQVKKDRELEEKRAERDRIILGKAVRLRQKRADTVRKLERVKQEREIAIQKYKEKLAKSMYIQSKKNDLQNQRYKMLLDSLLQEHNCWLSYDQIDEKINDSLFDKQKSTGLITKNSNHWRWHMITMNPKRILNPDFIRLYTQTSLESRMQIRGQVRSAKKIMAQDFLDPMIGTGEDRAKYRELVDRFADMFEKTNAQPDVEKYFDYLLSNQGHADFSYGDRWDTDSDDDLDEEGMDEEEIDEDELDE
mmetsp:Transcript_25264/g.25496  ORF Transcript_25264/g.25496 Transcript_25264/m.25496 type:complete len:280 (+) Transcript_25264:157-996(+)